MYSKLKDMIQKDVPYVKEWDEKTKELLNPITKKEPYLHDIVYHVPSVGSKFFKTYSKYTRKKRNTLSWLKRYTHESIKREFQLISERKSKLSHSRRMVIINYIRKSK